MTPAKLEPFDHPGYSVWQAELWRHDVTVAREHGKREFKIWIDGVGRGSELSFLSAQSRVSKLLLTPHV